MTEAGIMASGILIAEVMYITTDDDMPVKTAREIYPFAKLIEIPDTAEETKFALDCGLGQMAAVMLDQEHIEIKAQIHLDVMAVRDIIISNIDSVEEKTYDEGETDEAGLIGYVVKPGDDLWDIAKNNHTTEADIMEMNNMADGSVVPSQKLLIMRKVKNHRD
jgi:hypothetical protein